MERSKLFELMSELQLYGMKAAFDEIMATAVKRQHEPQRIIGDLLTAEINEKQARSIKYQLSIAKLPLAKDLDGFQFKGTPINETLVRDLERLNLSIFRLLFPAKADADRLSAGGLSPQLSASIIPAHPTSRGRPQSPRRR